MSRGSRAAGTNPRALGTNPRAVDPLRTATLTPDQLRSLNYGSYRRTAHWQELRRQVNERAGGVCERCHEQGLIDVHHLTYSHLGEEPLTDLLGLCRECHKAAHGLREIKIVDGYLIAANGETIGRLVSMTLDMAMGDVPGGTYKEGVAVDPSSTQVENTEVDGESTRGEEGRRQVKEVWDHYCQVFANVDGVDPSRMTLNATRARTIRNALKVRSVDECKRAIDGLARSPHHLGDNDRQTKYLDIRYALKGNSSNGESNEERIDKMVALAATVEPTAAAAPRLPEGVSVEKAKRRLEDLRQHISSGGSWEPTRAAEARSDLESWGFNIIELDAHPWAKLTRKEQ